VKQKGGAGVASMNPDNMLSAGLADDFDGTIKQARLVPWDYDGNLDHHILAVRLDIEPDEDQDQEPFSQHYSAGELDHFVPSLDGETPTDLESEDEEDWEGVYALRVGRRQQLNNSSNWAHWVGATIDAGFPVEELEADVSCFEGLYGHWNRIPQRKRSGIVVEEEGGRQRMILVLTEIHEKAKPKVGKSKAKDKSATKGKAAAKPVADDLDERLSEVVLGALADNDGTLPKTKLPGVVIKAFDGKEKAAAIKRVADVKFLGADDAAWTFDADEGVLTL
jgi:hypothetical protein